MATFLLGGLWHGATWMFVIWGGLHGGALVLHRFWQGLRRPMPPALAWLLTFLFVNFAWVFFRAKTMDDARRVLHGMVDIRSVLGQTVASIPTSGLAWGGWLSDLLVSIFPPGLVSYAPTYLALMAALFIVSQKNSLELSSGTLGLRKTWAGALLFCIAMYFSLSATSQVFLYFNF